jgi:hypothetical protein
MKSDRARRKVLAQFYLEGPPAKRSAGFVPNTVSARPDGSLPPWPKKGFTIYKTGRPKVSDLHVRRAAEIFADSGEYKEVYARMKEEYGIDKNPGAWRRLVDSRKSEH